MKRTLPAVFLVIGLFLMSSCTSRMEKLEKEVYSEDFTYDSKGTAEVEELLGLYIRSAEEQPADSAAPGYLFKAAELAMNLDRPQQAMELYNKIIYTYPDYEKTPECLFLLAFIYENTLQNYGKAKELYEMFLEKYPEHDFADDAYFSLQYLGKSPEELMKEFEAKNADSTDVTVL